MTRTAVHDQLLDAFGTVALRLVDPARDIDLIYSWVTQERARFWGMGDASREHVLEIYEYLDSLSTHHAYLVHRDGVPVALIGIPTSINELAAFGSTNTNLVYSQTLPYRGPAEPPASPKLL